MAYGQKNYNEIQGINGKYRINQIGCFLVSFCNLFERFGKVVEPLGLNATFRDRGIYIDVDDRIRDDLGWQSITAFDGSIVVTATGEGAPPTNNAIVKFVYGGEKTHFCLVADAANHLIVDSWDGNIKNWDVYGGPKAWAAYVDTTPQPVTPPPVSNAGKQLFLPSAAGTWRVYPLGAIARVGNEVGKLAPGQFPPGLTYDILGNPSPNVYTIQTQTYGQVNIYAGADTIAQFVDKPAPPPPAPEPPAPAPIVEPTPPPTPPTPPPVTVVVPEPTATVTTVTADPAAATTTTVSADHPLDWHETYSTKMAGKYKANTDTEVSDLDGIQVKLTLHKGQKVDVAGLFEKDGKKYYRTKKSADNGWWYGLPVEALDIILLDSDVEASFKLDPQFVNEAKKVFHNLTTREKMVAYMAKLQGFLLGVRQALFSKVKTNKKVK